MGEKINTTLYLEIIAGPSCIWQGDVIHVKNGWQAPGLLKSREFYLVLFTNADAVIINCPFDVPIRNQPIRNMQDNMSIV